MKLSFLKYSPTQNMTLLFPEPLPREQQAAAAAALIAYEGVYAEQAGFIEPPTLPGARLRLQMAGGEFCGNATMCLGAYLAREEGLNIGESRNYLLEVSGADAPLCCKVETLGENEWRGEVTLPGTARLTSVTLPDGRCFPLVCLPGISHIIAPQSRLSMAEAEKLLPQLCRELETDALGIMLTKDESCREITPLVYVKEIDSLYPERGCASGTAAVGAYLANRNGKEMTMDVAQPGGVLQVCACPEGALRIAGKVKLVAEGEAYI